MQDALPSALAATHDASLPLPKTVLDWVKVFGSGAVLASLTIGTGELIFSTRGGALFGYRILFVFVIISVLKWGLVLASARHMVLTGVHPYERMHDLPGPRGWLPLTLLLMGAMCMPVWICFHSGVLGNLTSWITGTRDVFNGGMDYVWAIAILLSVLILAASGGYSLLERVQMFIVTALSYPQWLPERYPQIANHSVWVETTRYVGVIGGASFDYMAYIRPGYGRKSGGPCRPNFPRSNSPRSPAIRDIPSAAGPGRR